MSARALLRFLAGIATIAIAVTPLSAAQNTTLRAVRGTVGYQDTKDGPFSRVVGTFLVNQNQFAVTQAASNALLQLPDSSEVALGTSTTVQVGQVTGAEQTAPTSMTLTAGAIRFSVKHPAGGQSNYLFQSNVSQLAVRGTVGLYSTGPNGDVVSCLDCAPGDVTVTANGNSFPLLTGQSASISLAGVVVVAATVAQLTAVFAGAGLNVATTAAPFAAGIAAPAAAAAGLGAAGTAAVAAGAAAGIGAGIAASSSSHPQASAAPVNVPLQAQGGIHVPYERPSNGQPGAH